MSIMSVETMRTQGTALAADNMSKAIDMTGQKNKRKKY